MSQNMRLALGLMLGLAGLHRVVHSLVLDFNLRLDLRGFCPVLQKVLKFGGPNKGKGFNIKVFGALRVGSVLFTSASNCLSFL